MEKNKNSSAGRGKFFAAGLLTGILVCLVAAVLVLRAVEPELLPHVSSSLSQESAQVFERSAIDEDTILKLQSLEEGIERYYYKAEEVTPEQLQTGLYRGIMKSLDDPYTEYYTKDEMELLDQQLTGIYYGIGAYISLDTMTNYPKISGVIRDTPAQAAGLMADDIIYEVDGVNTKDMSLDEVVSRVKGEEGTTVTLTLVREGENDYLHIDIKRAKINSPTVSVEMMEDGIGYLDLEAFDTVTTQQFIDGLHELEEGGMEGMILDLRANPGGDVQVVTAIADYFLPEGLVFYMEDRDGARTEYTCDGEKQIGIPLVVLVDGKSASAAEILSGGIQDAGVGTLVGEQTYGKGVVQTILTLKDESAIKITIADYYTINGSNINEIGITPDELVPFDREAYLEDGTDNQLERAKEILLEKMDDAN